jgi:hypothetical protein
MSRANIPTKAELRAIIDGQALQIKMLEGRVRGYQQALMSKTEKEGREKTETCPACGQVWRQGQEPTHKKGCSEWAPYLRRIKERARQARDKMKPWGPRT